MSSKEEDTHNNNTNVAPKTIYIHFTGEVAQ